MLNNMRLKYTEMLYAAAKHNRATTHSVQQHATTCNIQKCVISTRSWSRPRMPRFRSMRTGTTSGLWASSSTTWLPLPAFLHPLSTPCPPSCPPSSCSLSLSLSLSRVPLLCGCLLFGCPCIPSLVVPRHRQKMFPTNPSGWYNQTHWCLSLG